MKSSNLTLAKLRKLILITALVICPLLLSQTGNAQNASATLLSGGSSSISITSNQSFTLTLSITTDFISSGFTYFLQGTNSIDLFQVAARVNTSPYTDPTNDDATAFGGDAGNLKWTPGGTPGDSNLYDLGYTLNGSSTTAAYSQAVATLTLNTLGAAPGTYYLQLRSNSIVTDRTGGGFTDRAIGGPSGPIFTVTVVPEPTTVALAVLGGGALLVAVWRKQRAQV